jgi:hypothetical protein
VNSEPPAAFGGEALSPHIRQRIAFIAAMIQPDSANWSAIADAYEDLLHEANGDAVESSLRLLREPIQHQDAQVLLGTISTLLSADEASAPAA